MTPQERAAEWLQKASRKQLLELLLHITGQSIEARVLAYQYVIARTRFAHRIVYGARFEIVKEDDQR